MGEPPTMTKRQLGRIGEAAISEELARRDPAGAMLIAMAVMRAAVQAHEQRKANRAREAILAGGGVPNG
jgi:hypothetical protein